MLTLEDKGALHNEEMGFSPYLDIYLKKRKFLEILKQPFLKHQIIC